MKPYMISFHQKRREVFYYQKGLFDRTKRKDKRGHKIGVTRKGFFGLITRLNDDNMH